MHDMRRSGWLLLGIVAAAAVWTEWTLLAQNTLFHNGRWIVSKRKVALGVMGADSFLITRPALFKGRLNLNAWFGDQEVLMEGAVRLAELRFRAKLAPGGILTALLVDDGGFLGVRLSRDPTRPHAFVKGDSSGRFDSLAPLPTLSLREGWHRISLRRRGASLTVSVDGRVIAGTAAIGDGPARVGFRSTGALEVAVDDVVIVDDRGATWKESFSNRRHWGRLLGAYFLTFAAVATLAAIRLSPAAIAAGLAVLVGSGLAGWGGDYLLWSKLPIDVLSRPIGADPRRRALIAAESLRIGLFARATLLLAGEAYPTPRAVKARGYPSPSLWRGPFACWRHDPCRSGIGFEAFEGRKARRVLFLGTSQTVGAGAPTLEETFVAAVHRRIQTQLGGGVSLLTVNESVSGAEGPQLLADYLDRQVAFRPDLVVANLGHNDEDPDTLREVLTALAKENGTRGVKTFLIAEAGAPAAARRMEKAAEITRAVAERFGLPFENLNEFLNERSRADSGFLWWDTIHLTAYGQRLAAERLAPKILAELR